MNLQQLKSNANRLHFIIDVKGEYHTKDQPLLTTVEGDIFSLTIRKRNDSREILLQLEDINAAIFRFNFKEKKLTIIEFNHEDLDIYILNEHGRLKSDEDNFKLCFEDIAEFLGVDVLVAELNMNR